MQARRRLRRYFLAGILVITPVGATWIVLSWLFTTLDSFLGEPLSELVKVRIPGAGAALLLLLILVTGWFAYRTIGRRALSAWDAMLSRFPLTARIYRTANQISRTLFGRSQRIVRRVVLVPFPSPGSWAIAFVTSDESPVVSRTMGTPHVNVFLPTTPNPTSGYMLAVQRDQVREVDLTVEEAMKIIISGGAVDDPRAMGLSGQGNYFDGFPSVTSEQPAVPGRPKSLEPE